MRWRWWVLAGAVGAAAVTTGFFVWTGPSSEAARAAFQAWGESVRPAGYEVSAGSVEVTNAGIRLEDVAIAHPGEGWRWTGTRVMASGGGGDGLFLQIVGRQTFTYRIGDEPRFADFGAEALRLRVHDGEGARVRRISLETDSFILRRPSGDPVSARRARLDLTRGEGDGLLPDGSMVILAAADVVLPEHRRGPFGDTISTVAASVTFLRGVAGLDPEVEIPTWRSARNGRLRIEESQISWGLLDLEAEGDITLDERYRPEAVLDATMVGVLPVLDALMAAGLIGVDDASTFRFIVTDEMEHPMMPLGFRLRLSSGTIVMEDRAFGAPDLNLGTFGPLLGIDVGGRPEAGSGPGHAGAP